MLRQPRTQIVAALLLCATVTAACSATLPQPRAIPLPPAADAFATPAVPSQTPLAPSPLITSAPPSTAPPVLLSIPAREVKFTDKPGNVDADSGASWWDATYHVNSAAGLAALAALWHRPVPETDVDFTHEELLIRLAKPQYGCPVSRLTSFSSNGRFVTPVFTEPACNDPNTSINEPVQVQAYAFARQNLPVLPALDPETPGYTMQVQSRHTLEPTAAARSDIGEWRPRSIAFAPDGTLWLVSNANPLVYRLSSNGLPLPPIPLPEMPNDIALSSAGSAWVACDESVFRIDGTGQPQAVPLPEKSYYSIAIDGRGRIWTQGLDIGEATVEETLLGLDIYAPDSGKPLYPPNLNVSAGDLSTASDGSVWGISGTGVTQFDDQARARFQVPIYPNRGLAIDRKDHLWTRDDSGQLLESDNSGRPLGRYTLEGLTPGQSYTYAFDPQGALWVAPDGSNEVLELGLSAG